MKGAMPKVQLDARGRPATLARMIAYPHGRIGVLIGFVVFAILVLLMSKAPPASFATQDNYDRPRAEGRVAIAIHGGAGTIRRADMTAELEQQYRQTLEQALRAGHKVLADGGTSLDAMEASIVILEDSPLFNAGKGAVLTSEGRAEMDASVMEGHTLHAGAVASVTTIRNPIKAARAVMKQTPHVLLMGEGAEKFAAEAGLQIVENEYFITERRKKALEEAQRREREQGARVIGIGEGRDDTAPGRREFFPEAEGKFGTVGCVALDRHGNLAAGTSTGGLTNKRFGRVGDTPIIGAGNYAENATCAVSGTGQGEFFMRLMIAGDVAARMRYLHAPLMEAAAAQMQRMIDMKAQGGLIAMSPDGQVSFVFNTEGMYRGVIGFDGEPHIAIYGDAEDRIPGDHASNGGAVWNASFQPAR